MQRVSELKDEPEVGKFYLVPCIRECEVSGKWIPVIGPQHEDADYIEFPHVHYHHDIRFLPDSEIERVVRLYAEGHMECSREQFAMSVVCRVERYSGLAERVMRCRRAMLAFPREEATWLEQLERVYNSKMLSSCLRCPHRGMPLNGLPVKDGKVICPGHGLQWDVKTGELVKRV